VEKATLQKEAYLKDLVVQLLHEKDFSNSDMLDSLFTEIKEEFQS